MDVSLNCRVVETCMENRCNGVKNPIVPGTKLSKNFEEESKAESTQFKQTIGSLMYLTATRPDIMYYVCLLRRFMADPKESHMLAAKRVLRYITATTNLGILYQRGAKEELLGYSDSDYAGDMDDRKSTSGYSFMLSKGVVISASKSNIL